MEEVSGTKISEGSQGWECPRCHKINAPWKSQCDCVEITSPQPYYPPYYYPYYPYYPASTPWPPFNVPYIITYFTTNG
jgi:hypothetical protein